MSSANVDGDATPTQMALENELYAAGAAAPDAYGGMRAAPDGGLEVFVVRGRSGRFLARLPRAVAKSAGTSWYLTPVEHSYQSLLEVTSSIASDAPRLRSDGILLGQWGPSPADNRVVVHLQRYSREAAERLLHLFGSEWIIVSSQPAALVPTADDRFHDQAPFFGGDGIWRRGIDPIGTHYCGSGINMKSPVGTQYATTAGHCGSYTWKTNDTYNLTLGPTAVNYFSQTGGDFDFESISASTGGYVWGDNGYSYAIMGSTTPPPSTKVTFDGIISGEVHEVVVQGTDQCDQVIDGGPTTCHLTAAFLPGVQVCANHDSGSPVIVRFPTAHEANAAGDVVGGNIYFPTGNGYDYCYYTQIQYAAQATGLQVQLYDQ